MVTHKVPITDVALAPAVLYKTLNIYRRRFPKWTPFTFQEDRRFYQTGCTCQSQQTQTWCFPLVQDSLDSWPTDRI